MAKILYACSTVPTYAIIHTESGMLVGLGASERAAWADAERESRAAHIDLDREEHECREAEVGKAWRASSTGGLTVAEEYDVAAATLGRLGGRAKSPAKTAASAENGAQGGRPRAAVVAALVRVGRAIGCLGVDGDAMRIDQAVEDGYEAMAGEDQAEIDASIQAARQALGGHRLHPGQHARKGELSAAVAALW